jgi:endonuclease V-like protein UPF0215 family
MIRRIKPEIRILGFDDGAFEPRSKGSVPVIGVIFRGGKFLDGAVRTDVAVDGTDATEKIVKLINSTRHKQQLKVIMLDGITVAGFNVIDIKQLHEKTGIPIIVINRKMPDIKKVEAALRNLDNFETRWHAIENAGEIKQCAVDVSDRSMSVEQRKIYFQAVGLDDTKAREIIKISTTHSYIPEPLRVAHLIAEAVTKGESGGRA